MEMPVQRQKGWWGRNWPWVLPVGLLGVILACAGCCGGIFVFVFGVLKSSDVYKQALAKAQANPAVVAQLAEPIQAGWMVMGSIQDQGATGTAGFEFPISGPKGSATIHVQAIKAGGTWTYTALWVQIHPAETRIELLATDSAPAK
jgi:hypothetical protein